MENLQEKLIRLGLRVLLFHRTALLILFSYLSSVSLRNKAHRAIEIFQVQRLRFGLKLFLSMGIVLLILIEVSRQNSWGYFEKGLKFFSIGLLFFLLTFTTALFWENFDKIGKEPYLGKDFVLQFFSFSLFIFMSICLLPENYSFAHTEADIFLLVFDLSLVPISCFLFLWYFVFFPHCIRLILPWIIFFPCTFVALFCSFWILLQFSGKSPFVLFFLFIPLDLYAAIYCSILYRELVTRIQNGQNDVH